MTKLLTKTFMSSTSIRKRRFSFTTGQCRSSYERVTFQIQPRRLLFSFELLFLAAEFQTESLVTQWTVLDHVVRFLYESTGVTFEFQSIEIICQNLMIWFELFQNFLQNLEIQFFYLFCVAINYDTCKFIFDVTCIFSVLSIVLFLPFCKHRISSHQTWFTSALVNIILK